jgi:hypothetical protein
MMNPGNDSTVKLPSISIVTPSFNQGEFLEECIDSVLSQNYPRLEYIIMDGGSTDNSVEIIRKYEKYLTYWQSRPDGGQYNAVNEGFRKTSGEIMAWLNSDDKYHRDAFFKVAAIFDQVRGAEWITGHPTHWGKNGELSLFEPILPTYCRKDFLEGRYNRPFLQQESTFWKRSLWDRAGGYLRTDLDYAGDLELWVRFFRHAVLCSVGTFLGGYRNHGNQKAQLFMDRYVAEAETVLAEELSLYGSDFISMSPEAPTPIAFDVEQYRHFLNILREGGLTIPSSQMAAGEDAVNVLLGRIKMLQAGFDENNHFVATPCNCIVELEAIRASLSWRITKPLRWLGDKLRWIASSK